MAAPDHWAAGAVRGIDVGTVVFSGANGFAESGQKKRRKFLVYQDDDLIGEVSELRIIIDALPQCVDPRRYGGESYVDHCIFPA